MSRPGSDDREALALRARASIARDAPLPLPGRGDTLGRWRALAAIAAEDVSLAKILEAHHDALAILAELAPGVATALPAGALLAVWAAEPPDARLEARFDGDGVLRLDGRKAWCSGADVVDAALVTAWLGEDRILALVEAGVAGMSAPDDSWRSLGMLRVDSGRVAFDDVPARQVGEAGAYLSRPGFWHGGAGIAACWYGAAMPLATAVASSPRIDADPLAQVHAGVVDIAMHAAACVLRALAADIDAAPADAHRHAVVRARATVERACTVVLDRSARALGPAPLCTDAAHAARVADLSVFLRQCPADRDWAVLGAAGLPAAVL